MEYKEIHFKTYNEYLKHQSQEWKKNIDYFAPLSEELKLDLPKAAYKETAIKIVFKDGNWLRAYVNGDYNNVEWY